MRPKPLRVRKTVQNRLIDPSETASDRRNRRRRHKNGEVSPRQRCHCSSILVSPRKDVGTVTAEHTGYQHEGHYASPDSLCQLRPQNLTEPAKPWRSAAASTTQYDMTVRVHTSLLRGPHHTEGLQVRFRGRNPDPVMGRAAGVEDCSP